MGRPRPDPILKRLRAQLGDNPDAWHSYLDKTFPHLFNSRTDKEARPDEARGDKARSESYFQSIRVVADARGVLRCDGSITPRKNMGRKITECDPTKSETDAREAAADDSIRLGAAWQQFVGFVSTALDWAWRKKDKRDAAKQLVVEWARTQHADGETPPDLPDGPITAEDLQRSYARGEVHVDVEFRVSDRRNHVIDIRFAYLPPDPDDDLPDDDEPAGVWTGLKWRATTPRERS